MSFDERGQAAEFLEQQTLSLIGDRDSAVKNDVRGITQKFRSIRIGAENCLAARDYELSRTGNPRSFLKRQPQVTQRE